METGATVLAGEGRGAVLRLYREGVEVFEGVVETVDVNPSWVTITTATAHGGEIGDSWRIGAIGFEWRSGKIDPGDLLSDVRLHSVDLTMNE